MLLALSRRRGQLGGGRPAASRAIGDQLTCVHVNHGLLRKGEPEQVVRVFRDEIGREPRLRRRESIGFLGKLAGVADPEQKRKIIGAEFIRVFEEEARKLEGIDFLAQGTIYPDIVESGTKTAKMVKSPPQCRRPARRPRSSSCVEPLRQLFKDEVRACGTALGLPDAMVYRQPFPGPGLGRALPRRDHPRAPGGGARIGRDPPRGVCHAAGLDKTVWQYFTVVPDFKSVGVRDNARCFEYPVILRAVNTIDAMTADVEQVPWPVLHEDHKPHPEGSAGGQPRAATTCPPSRPRRSSGNDR